MIFSQSRKEAVSDMKEYKVGEEITLVVKEVKGIHCHECFFCDNDNGCSNSSTECLAVCRSDGKNVIFVEKGK